MTDDLFTQAASQTAPEEDTSLFAGMSPDAPTSSVDRSALTNKALIMSLARLPDGQDPEMALPGALEESRILLDNLQEQAVRNEIATARATSRLTGLSSLKRDMGPTLSPEASERIDQAYGEVLNWDRDRDAQVAMEQAAIDKIEDMAARDPVQAKVLMDNLEFGDANQVKRDFQVKMMKLMQLAEVYEKERQEEGWGSFLVNFALGMVPTNYNFSRTGVVDGADNSAFDFLQVGSALRKQSKFVWNMPMAEFVEYVKEGGALDKSIRANADDFLFGKYDPTAATDIINNLRVQSENDRWWANTWGVVEIVSGIPISKVTNVTRTLVTAGARKEVVSAIRETADVIIAEGPEAAAKKFGLTEKEVQDGLKISAIDPDVATPNFVPLGLSVAARDEAARKALADLPGIVQAERMTDMNEIKAAFDATVDQQQKRFGRPLLDVSPVKTEVLADGSNVNYIELTFGKEDGGLFASQRTARNFAKSRGVPGASIENIVTTKVEIRPGVPKEYSLRVYHGTDGAFDEIQASQGGKLGPAVYFAPDPNVSDDYTSIANMGKKYYMPGSSTGGPNIRPHFVNPDKIFGIRNIEGWSIQDLRNAFDQLGVDGSAFLDDAERLLAARAEKGQSQLLDSQTAVKAMQRAFKDEELDGMMNVGERLNQRLEEMGYEGIAGNMWGDLEIAVFKPEFAPSQFNPLQEIRDVSGGFAIKTRVNMPETGFLTDPLHAPTQSWWARAVGTAPRITDRVLHGKSVQAGSTINRMQRIIEQQVLKPFRTLPAGSKELTRQIAAAGTNAQKWWTDSEFQIMTQRALNRAATDHELEAYRALQRANDVDWVLRNDLIYKENILNGFENVTLNTRWGQNFEVLGKVNYSLDNLPNGRVYDASTNTHYTTANPLSPARLEAMRSEGYALVRIKGSVSLPDGTEVNQVLIKKSDGDFKPLARNQLPYAEGGHRLYEADYKYFVKQASFGRQPDTGEDFMRNPNTFVAAKNVQEGNRWANRMNAALRAFRENKNISASELDDTIFMGDHAFPSGEEFLLKIRQGHINQKHDFETVFDRELPSSYKDASPNALSFMDVDDLGANDYLRTTGRMFYSGKGEALKDTTGDLAMTVDPYDALATSLRQVTRQSGLSNYKFEALERFMQTYGPYLEPGRWKTPVDIFNNAPIKRGVDKKIQDQINAQRAATRTVLGFETPLERAFQDRTRQMAEFVLGAGDNKAKKLAHDAVWWFKTENPLSKLRGLAFDAKLGMFNLGQLFIQTSTMFSATAMSPKFGMQGMMGVLPMHGYLLSRGSENMLDLLAKRGVGKSMGFKNTEEFKEYSRMAYKSGFMDMNGSHVMVGEYGPSAAFGSFGEKLHRGREAARTFFYTAETYNRLVAFRIGYGEALEKGMKVTDKGFWNEVLGLADDYSFNMTHESASWWQKGLLSIPTQFWAYNVRMMDAMLGTRFTPAQRLRLAGMQVLVAGSAGIPLVEALSAYLKNEEGEAPDIESLLGTVDRGLVDRFWYEVTGADMQLGEKLGTGGWVTDVVRDIFGAGEYGEKPFDEMIGGASWSITKSTGGAMWNAARYANAEGGAGELTRDALLKMAMEVSTIGNAAKANMVANYGMYKSKGGTVLASDLPSEDALFVALGFQPQEARDLGYMMNYLKDKQETIKEAATVVRNWRQEAFTNPDAMEENMKKVSAFMQLQRPEDRLEILKAANNITDPSLYDRIARKYNEETMKEEVINSGETN